MFFVKLRILPLKFYFARIAFNLGHRLRNKYCTRQTLAVVLRRRNLLLASLAGFSFHTSGITDEELAELSAADPFQKPDPSEGWENVYSDERIAVFRRKLNGHHIYEYRCIGSYSDISVEDFIRAQYDVSYRRQWDENVQSLEVLEEEAASGAQVIRWETKYPYPLYPRLYIYIQRKSVDPEAKSVMVVSRAMDTDSYPDITDKNSSVRVTDYSSKMLVRAHTDMDKNGLDFVLVYHDDPKAPIPKKVYDYGVSVVGPNFLTSVHNAACKLAEEREKLLKVEEQSKKEEEEEQLAEPERETATILSSQEEPVEAEKKEEEEPEVQAQVEEEEPVDPLARARIKCASEKRVQELKAVLEKCNQRVRRTEGSQESCHMEMVDWVQALDKCAIPKAFQELK